MSDTQGYTLRQKIEELVHGLAVSEDERNALVREEWQDGLHEEAMDLIRANSELFASAAETAAEVERLKKDQFELWRFKLWAMEVTSRMIHANIELPASPSDEDVKKTMAALSSMKSPTAGPIAKEGK